MRCGKMALLARNPLVQVFNLNRNVWGQDTILPHHISRNHLESEHYLF